MYICWSVLWLLNLNTKGFTHWIFVQVLRRSSILYETVTPEAAVSSQRTVFNWCHLSQGRSFQASLNRQEWVNFCRPVLSWLEAGDSMLAATHAVLMVKLQYVECKLCQVLNIKTKNVFVTHYFLSLAQPLLVPTEDARSQHINSLFSAADWYRFSALVSI